MTYLLYSNFSFKFKLIVKYIPFNAKMFNL